MYVPIEICRKCRKDPPSLTNFNLLLQQKTLVPIITYVRFVGVAFLTSQIKLILRVGVVQYYLFEYVTELLPFRAFCSFSTYTTSRFFFDNCSVFEELKLISIFRRFKIGLESLVRLVLIYSGEIQYITLMSY
jgi:hypothetical protein